jgi:integrase
MARTVHKLTAREVVNARKPGKLGDGGGLALQVAKGGSKSWLFRFMAEGREREMGLGPYPAVTLAQAREKAAACRAQRADGVDPLAAKRAVQAAARPTVTTFAEAAAKYIEAHGTSWGATHVQQWESTLADHASPIIGTLAVGAVGTDHLMAILKPIWANTPEMARRLRGRIECVLDWAAAHKLRSGDNPARWRGHLAHLLPTRASPVKHHAAMPYNELPAFMAALRARGGVSAHGLEFTILTALRSGEARGARWDEIDTEGRVWTVPAERMKEGKLHRVPLSNAALAVLAQRTRDNAHVFPGQRRGKPIQKLAMPGVLESMGRNYVTVHGFRSTFRDWAAERTDFPSEVVEMALAHTIGSAVEAAYRRGDLFDKRRALMEEWGTYCGKGEPR